MDATDPRRERAVEDDTPADETVVCCHETKPGRHVFTERGNTDAWLSCDVVVSLRR